MRCLSKAKLDSRLKGATPEVVFHNVVSIRALFYGNLKKLSMWRRFTNPEEIKKLLIMSSQFDEPFGRQRVYGQYQFPADLTEFEARLESCRLAPWPISSDESLP